jgi:hypothetical protein
MEERKTECGRCGRVLKSEKSKRDGFGPVCLRKHEAEMVEAEANQTRAD